MAFCNKLECLSLASLFSLFNVCGLGHFSIPCLEVELGNVGGNLLQLSVGRRSLRSEKCSALRRPSVDGFPGHGFDQTLGEALCPVVNGVGVVAEEDTVPDKGPGADVIKQYRCKLP